MFKSVLMIITIGIILGVAFLLSDNRSLINKRTVLAGLGLQVLLILFALKTPIGFTILETTAFGIQSIADFGLEGVSFVWGDLTNMNVLFVNVLVIIIFVSALISLLRYWGIISFLIEKIGGLLSKILGTNKAETFNAVANIVVGQIEAPLMIKSYFNKLSESELFAIMVSGMGSASASILIGYSAMGIPMKYLIISVFASMFSSLIISKIIKPNTSQDDEEIQIEKLDATNAFDAISQGASDGVSLVLSIMGSLVAFVGIVALINGILGIFNVSLTDVLTMIFTPIAWLFKIPNKEIESFASLLGIKLTINEFVAFTSMSEIIGTLSERTIAVLTVALCNFANLSSIGIQIGGLGAIDPNCRGDVSKLVVKALIAANLSTLLSAALVGLMF